MNTIKNIDIRNFRGFDNLEVDNFKQINLFLGKNNSGKSSILEAIFLIIGMSNPNLPDNINRLRGFSIKDADDFKYLFHKLKFNNNPEFKCSFADSSERTLQLNPLYKKHTSNEPLSQKINNEDISLDATTSSPKVTGLELAFSLKQKHTPKKTYKSSILFSLPEITQNIANKYKEELHAVFIAGDSKESNALIRYSEIVKRKKGEVVLNALNKIDPNIESIHPLPDGLFLSYKGIEELIPVNIAGDGIRRYLNIVTTIAEKKESVIIIDEIENGLHFSAHKLLWESIITISKEFNSQLFISTHNIETLRCLTELLQDEKYNYVQDNLSVYNVSHTKKSGIKTYRYSFDGLKDAINTNTEIR